MKNTTNDGNAPTAAVIAGDPAPTTVAAEDTVPPQVKWEPEHRSYQDKLWGILFALSYIAFLGCGFTLVARAYPRYDFVSTLTPVDQVGSIQILETIQVRVVSEHYRDDVVQCCGDSVAAQDDFVSAFTGDSDSPDWLVQNLCHHLSVETATRKKQRQLQSDFTGIVTNDTTYNYDDDAAGFFSSKPPTSNFEPGDGMFDAFLEAPGVIVVLCFLALFLALSWIALLRYFATPIVFCTEAVKVGFFIYLAVVNFQVQATNSAIVALVCAVLVICWDIYVYKQLLFAGKILSYAAKSFGENMAMFCAFLPILAVYAGNAYLFVMFYAKSFEVVEVQEVSPGLCRYSAPSYTTPIVIYCSLSYLWTVLFFYTMRLSIIATVIGSWHFHPDHQPGIARAVVNTCSTSMGTLSVASLIQTIAEKLNKIFLEQSLWKQCLNPVFCIILPIYCLCGHCIKLFILMLTKFSVILHVFTGKSWLGSAKKVFKILKRHFKGGFVTEYASSSVLALGSYVFSMGIYFIAWVWLDDVFNTKTFIGVNDDTILVVVWLFFALFNIYNPVLGLYLLIVINRFLSAWEVNPAYWVTPFAATFVGIISMMFFSYLAGIFLDTVDVLFLCFAIDRDNQVDMAENEFAKLVKEGCPTVLETPDCSEDGDYDGEDADVEVRVVQVGNEEGRVMHA